MTPKVAVAPENGIVEAMNAAAHEAERQRLLEATEVVEELPEETMGPETARQLARVNEAQEKGTILFAITLRLVVSVMLISIVGQLYYAIHMILVLLQQMLYGWASLMDELVDSDVLNSTQRMVALTNWIMQLHNNTLNML